MRIGDYLIQNWRMKIAARWIPPGSRVLDIGCHQGELFYWLGEAISSSVGFDPLYAKKSNSIKHQFFAEYFQSGLTFANQSFDVVTILATIEHIHEKSMIAQEAARLLHSGGRVIVTAPSPLVDKILDILLFLHIIDGMSLEDHHGFLPAELPAIFIPTGFSLRIIQKFQFGLNNLYVFERT